MPASGAPTQSLPTNLQTVDAFEQWERQHAREGSYEFVRGFVRGRIFDRGGIE